MTEIKDPKTGLTQHQAEELHERFLSEPEQFLAEREELLKVAEIEENKEKTPEELEYDDKFHKCLIKKLKEVGIPCGNHRARQMMRRDYEEFDYIIGMDAWNIRNIMRIIGSDPEKKVSMLLDFTDRPGTEIADPWYTGNFDATYDDVLEGCTGLLEHLKNIL